MNKQPDFGNDLAALNENVNAEVGDVLSALEHKRSTSRPVPKIKESSQANVEAESTPEDDLAKEPVAASSVPRRQRSASRSRLPLTVEHDEPLENVTTRLRQKTNELLTEAALRQRLKKEDPSTRQAIIEAALGDWFRKRGYGRVSDDATGD